MPLSTAVPLQANPPSAPSSDVPCARPAKARDWRLHRHADYQRVYQNSRKQFASLFTYFVAPQPPERADVEPHGSAGRHMAPRVGITAGKVLGKAVERNRIKRRMRAAITANLDALLSDVDVVLHPKRSVLTAEWTVLRNEVRRIFVKIEESQARSAPKQASPEPKSRGQEIPEQKSPEQKSPEQKSREQKSRERRLPEPRS